MGRLALADARPSGIVRPEIAPKAGARLTIVSWNLGYGGLGAESDFVTDGGKHVFPPSRAIVAKNVAGIVSTLKSFPDADVFVFPEAARPGPANLWHDLLGALTRTFPKAERLFSPDFFTRWLPWPLRAEHGLAIYARRHIARAVIEPLPLEPTKIGGLIRRAYSARVVYLPMDDGRADWAIIGVHLAAFDQDGDTRKRQVQRVLDLAQHIHAQGHPVVIGGDFNLVLTPTSFPNTTEQKYLFWVFAFPMEALPAGWRIGADPRTPSVRTDERPYAAGENYTAIVDGFIVSPDVAIEEVTTRDVGFRYSDHQPVRIVLRRID